MEGRVAAADDIDRVETAVGASTSRRTALEGPKSAFRDEARIDAMPPVCRRRESASKLAELTNWGPYRTVYVAGRLRQEVMSGDEEVREVEESVATS